MIELITFPQISIVCTLFGSKTMSIRNDPSQHTNAQDLKSVEGHSQYSSQQLSRPLRLFPHYHNHGLSARLRKWQLQHLPPTHVGPEDVDRGRGEKQA